MKKKRGWYLIGRYEDWPALIYVLAGPCVTRRQARIWHDGATKLTGLDMTCEFVEAKTIDQWQRLGILRRNIWESGGPMLSRPPQKSVMTLAHIEEALDDGEITAEQLAQLLRRAALLQLDKGTEENDVVNRFVAKPAGAGGDTI